MNEIFNQEKPNGDLGKTIVTGIGIISGSSTCSFLGAAVGFVAGPFGSLVGAIPGAVLGGIVGGIVGNKVGAEVDKRMDKQKIDNLYDSLEPGEELIIEERIVPPKEDD